MLSQVITMCHQDIIVCGGRCQRTEKARIGRFQTRPVTIVVSGVVILVC